MLKDEASLMVRAFPGRRNLPGRVNVPVIGCKVRLNDASSRQEIRERWWQADAREQRDKIDRLCKGKINLERYQRSTVNRKLHYLGREYWTASTHSSRLMNSRPVRHCRPEKKNTNDLPFVLLHRSYL